jgi:transglutaminase-like putative cysteine protease
LPLRKNFLKGIDGDLITFRNVVRFYELARMLLDPAREMSLPSLTIRHITTYRYRQPVAFGEHRMMLFPRDSHDQKVIDATLEVSPKPSNLRFTRDAFGNHVAIAQFDGRSSELCFESIVILDHSPADLAKLDSVEAAWSFPVTYSADEEPDHANCIRRRHPDPDNEVERWTRQFLHCGGPIGTLELVGRLSQDIHERFLYRRRETKGIQLPHETLRSGHGSCRDFALLMIEAARSLGLAARFASGYLAVPSESEVEPTNDDAVDPAYGSTHAWAQVYLPSVGWIDFDPTNGSIGKAALVTVAVVPDPDQALPLHGTFFGFASDPLGMDVQVSVTRPP